MEDPHPGRTPRHPNPAVDTALHMLSHVLMLLKALIVAEIAAVDEGASPDGVEHKPLSDFEMVDFVSMESEFAVDELERYGWGIYERDAYGGFARVTARS